jgi:aryl-alcohol dehydrogenase-like predicted oxidoreductase
MNRVCLPNTDLSVSRIALGAADFGSKLDLEKSAALLDRYVELGGNFVDTAHCYAGWLPDGVGVSEQALGQLIRSGRYPGLVISSKGGHPRFGEHYPRPDAFMTPEQVERDLMESLGRLGLDTIDLYSYHRDDESIPVDELVDAMNQWIDRRLIRSAGVSNWSVDRLEAANGYAKRHSKHGFVALQNQSSFAIPNWRPEGVGTVRYHVPGDADRLAKCQVASVPYSATANGYFGSQGEKGEQFHNHGNAERLELTQKIAQAYGVTPNQIALCYLLHRQCLTIPLMSTANFAHLDDAMDAVEITFDPVTIQQLETLTPS